MWKGVVDLIMILALIVLYLYGEKVTGDEFYEENYVPYEYKQVLQGIPSFIEYLFNAVEEHPEILEKNDITVFEKAAEEGDERITYNKRTLKSIPEEHCKLKYEECEENEGINDVESTKRKPDKIVVSYEFSTKASMYNDLLLMIGLKENICEIKSEKIVKHDKSEDKSKKSQENRKQKYNKNIIQKSDDVDWEAEAYLGFRSSFSLDVTPEEIEESHIMTEIWLEEYNKLNFN